jgi:hypothetical protein
VGLLLAGVVSKVIFVGVGGFVVMLACAMWALTSWRHMGGGATTRAGGVSRGAGAGRGSGAGRGPAGAARGQRRGRASRKDRRGRAGGTGFMERLEERWRRRQEGDR